MGIMIYDSTSQAFKETSSIKTYDNTNKAWKNIESLKTYENGVWIDKQYVDVINNTKEIIYRKDNYSYIQCNYRTYYRDSNGKKHILNKGLNKIKLGTSLIIELELGITTGGNIDYSISASYNNRSFKPDLITSSSDYHHYYDWMTLKQIYVKNKIEINTSLGYNYVVFDVGAITIPFYGDITIN